jgi:hypothetical protein
VWRVPSSIRQIWASFPASQRYSTSIVNVHRSIALTAVWRNGSASDYESGGCSFEYYLGHFFPHASTRRNLSVVPVSDRTPENRGGGLLGRTRKRFGHEIKGVRQKVRIGTDLPQDGQICSDGR